MGLSLQSRALLVKLFYQNGDSAPEALRKFRNLNKLRKGPMTSKGLRKMVAKFEATGSLGVRPGRGKKPVPTEVVEEVAVQVEEDKASNFMGSSSVRRVAKMLDRPRSTVHRILRNILRYYPYKISLVQQLLQQDCNARLTFSLQFLARCEVDSEWPWNILWSDEAHFHLDGSVNTHNCRIWASEHPRSTLDVPLHSPKVTVWCGFTASFMLQPYFFEELTPSGVVTCTITKERYASMLQNAVVPSLQSRQCLGRTLFMQDGATPHIATCVKDVLKTHFTEERVISRHFPNAWPARSPDLNPCDFWLWGYLKDLVGRDNPRTLPDLKSSICRHVLNISTHSLRSTVEHAIFRFQKVADNGGHHIEHDLS